VQGFSASATGEVLEHLSLTAAYTYLNLVIVSDNSVCSGPLRMTLQITCN
jgi:hypothetical protein